MNTTVSRRSRYDFSDGKLSKKQIPDAKAEEKSAIFDFGEEADTDNDGAFERAARRQATKKTRELILRLFIIGVIITALCLCALVLFFRVESVSVSGSSVYGEEMTAAVADRLYGENILFVKQSELADEIMRKYPMIKSVSVDRSYPSGVSVTVTDDRALYYCVLDREYYLLSNTLRIVGRTDDAEAVEGLLYMEACDIKAAIVGTEMEFYGQYQYSYTASLLKAISEHPLGERITCVDINDKFDIRLNYEDRFTIKIGVAENVETKLTLAQAYIATLAQDEYGIIDASDIEIGSYTSLKAMSQEE